MSFREKSVWISFLIMLALFGVWAWNFGRGLTGQAARADVVRLSIMLLIFAVVLEVVLHIVLAIWSPREARTPRDERERLIELYATRIAFRVLVGAALLTVGSAHIGARTGVLMNAMMLSVILALLVKFGSEVVLFRRPL
jgi:heme/copper-type cytochrome/quinol oxidase subunit 2